MTKLTRETLADRLLAELERQILAGRIAVGEALPNERELSEAYGVGRTTVREAIQRVWASRFRPSRTRLGLRRHRGRIAAVVESAATACRIGSLLR